MRVTRFGPVAQGRSMGKEGLFGSRLTPPSQALTGLPISSAVPLMVVSGRRSSSSLLPLPTLSNTPQPPNKPNIFQHVSAVPSFARFFAAEPGRPSARPLGPLRIPKSEETRLAIVGQYATLYKMVLFGDYLKRFLRNPSRFKMRKSPSKEPMGFSQRASFLWVGGLTRSKAPCIWPKVRKIKVVS